MDQLYFAILKLLHLLGAGVLFGTGMGIAFFMIWAHRTGDPRAIATTAKIVVTADYIFTATAAIMQPITGGLLAIELGYTLTESWIVVSLGLYVLTGLCWLPVVRLQLNMRDLAAAAAAAEEALPQAYCKAQRKWFWLGWPAFTAMVAIYWLMITKPELF